MKVWMQDQCNFNGEAISRRAYKKYWEDVIWTCAKFKAYDKLSWQYLCIGNLEMVRNSQKSGNAWELALKVTNFSLKKNIYILEPFILFKYPLYFQIGG